jgi:hypothetical protein
MIEAGQLLLKNFLLRQVTNILTQGHLTNKPLPKVYI